MYKILTIALIGATTLHHITATATTPAVHQLKTNALLDLKRTIHKHQINEQFQTFEEYLEIIEPTPNNSVDIYDEYLEIIQPEEYIDLFDEETTPTTTTYKPLEEDNDSVETGLGLQTIYSGHGMFLECPGMNPCRDTPQFLESARRCFTTDPRFCRLGCRWVQCTPSQVGCVSFCTAPRGIWD